MPARIELVALAASAGGLKALSHLLAELPADFPAAMVVVQHLDPRHKSMMAEILTRRVKLVVSQAIEGVVARPGTVWLAPPDHHLLVNRGGVLTLTQTELVHFSRPSADLLFESVAASYRERAVGVVLSGSGSDGAMGARAIKKTGGTLIVQDPASAEFPGMPGAARETGLADFILPLEQIADKLCSLTMEQPAA
jgi:two-component system, chemotaxis family, protein-glutamate methylesterase/glutaminase